MSPVDDEGGLAAKQGLPGDGSAHATFDAGGVPDDAGPYAAALESILSRIPDPWGRWIDHDAGWYPLVVSVDQQLAEVDPDYVIHQVKEKYGTLRFYCSPCGDQPDPRRQEFFDSVVADAQRASTVTCERCGQPGVLRHNGNLVKTLCTPCADTLGYMK
jgi:hypothetical protein